MDLLNATEIITKDGSSTQGLSRDPKIVLLYFPAHWCGPCRGFTLVLTEFYKEIAAAGKDLEIIFVSSNEDEAGWKTYWEEMPWVSVRFGHENVPAIE
jgi:nucleoredoxin